MSEASSVAVPVSSVLPPLALALPAAGALLAAWAGEGRSRLRGLAAVASTAATFAVCLALLVKVFDAVPVACTLRVLDLGRGFRLALGVDALGAFFGLFASLLWLAASLHSFDYLAHEEKRTRFYAFMLLTEAATLGVFFVQDFFSLFVFFEAMGLLAFMLVIHNQSAEARAAAIKYVYMTVIGGLSLLGGIWLYLYYSGGTGFAPPAGSAWLAGGLKAAALALFIGGFGVKAGMVPLHVWLPDAHPAAPSPASALLSGVMIKAGAYGILRVILTIFYLPAAEGAGEGGHAAHAVQTLGFVIIWLGIATMVIGMLLALFQDDVKRTLAYSSVSQMGYILMGAGCLAFLGAEGSMGLAGSLYHLINHAFFKGLFFLAAGSVLFSAHQLNMFELGGLWRKMPLTCALWCVAALGITGIALFNGFVSKTLLHHAVVESHHLAEAGGLWSAGAVKAAEVLFIITSGGTIAYITKMTYYAFFRRPEAGNRHVEEAKEAPPWMLAGCALLAAGVLFNGLFPGVVLRHLIVPVLSSFPGLEHAGAAHLGEISIFTWANLKELFIPLAIGITVFAYGARADLFHLGEKKRFDLFGLRLPARLGVDYWYQAGARGFLAGLQASARAYAAAKGALLGAVRAAVDGARRMPREALGAVKLETACVYLARWSRAALEGGRDSYAGLREKGAAWVKGAPARAARAVRRYFPEELSRLGGDISFGPLMVAVILLCYLVTRLV